MITVTGIIENTEGVPISRLVTFESASTPIDEGGGIITANTTMKIQSSPADGSFSIQLRPGNYNVTYGTTPRATTFQIAIQTGMDGTTQSIDGLIVSTFAALPGQAPFVVWNGDTPFNLTFEPTAPPTGIPVTVQSYVGGHITNEHYHYKASYVTGTGETELAEIVNFLPSAGANQALRLTFPAAPSGVTHLRIWRNNSNADQSTMYLLAELSPATPFYDDWESNADFSGRSSLAPPAPTYNSTAGEVSGIAGTKLFSFSKQGMFAHHDIEFLPTFICGIVGASPNGTRWRLTFTNDGGISIDAA